MSETLSIRIDSATKLRLHALAKNSRRTKSFVAAEAIAAYLERAEHNLFDLQAGIAELDAGKIVSHQETMAWLNQWDKKPSGGPAMTLIWSDASTEVISSLANEMKQDSHYAARVAAQLRGAAELLAAHPDVGRPGRLYGTREIVTADATLVLTYRLRHDRVEIISVSRTPQR